MLTLALSPRAALVRALASHRVAGRPLTPAGGDFWYPRGLRDDVEQLGQGGVLTDPARETVAAALAGDAAAIRALVAELTPVIQASAVRALLRRRALAKGSDVRQLLDDMVQDAFVELFREGGRALRSWDPARGMGLHGFVSLVTEQRVAAQLRSRRKNPWSEELAADDEGGDEPSTPEDPEHRIASRQELAKLFERVHAELSPLGRDLFQRLIVDEESIASVASAMNMSTSAVQAWSSRIKRLLAKLWAEMAAGERGVDA